MAKPNYQYEKRQRDIAKKKKQDEKRARKQVKNEGEPAGDDNAPASGTTAAEGDAAASD